MWASTLCPFSSSTRNMALGSGSVTVPSTSIASFFGNLRVILATGTPDPPTNRRIRLRLEADSQYTGRPRTPSTTSENGLRSPRIRPLTCGFERRSTAGREHLVPVLGHGDRVLEVRRQGTVLGHDGPAVGKHARLPAADVDHRLHGNDQPGLEDGAAAGPPVVGDLRL